MSAQDTPRAFPSAAIDDAFGGMSLRDWFAGLAMQADLTANLGNADAGTMTGFAEDAYRMADAMMAERAKRAARRG